MRGKKAWQINLIRLSKGLQKCRGRSTPGGCQAMQTCSTWKCAEREMADRAPRLSHVGII